MWQHTFHLGNSSSESSVKLVVEVVEGLGYSWAQLIGFSHELLMLLIVLIVWVPAKGFAEQLQFTQLSGRGKSYLKLDNAFSLGEANIPKSTKESWNPMQQQYSAIKELTTLVNWVFGWVQCSYFLQTALFYSARFDEMFQEQQEQGKARNWFDISVNSFFFMITMMTLILSADVYKQVLYKRLISTISKAKVNLFHELRILIYIIIVTVLLWY